VGMNKQIIQKFAGPIIGTITTQPNGDAVAQKFAGPIVGTYDAKTDTVRKFGGPIIGKGRALLGSLFD